MNERTPSETGASPDPAILKIYILKQTARQELDKVLSVKFYALFTKRNRDTDGLESLKLVQSAIERYLKEKTLHSYPLCSLGSFTTQRKSIAELHRLHPQIPQFSKDNETSQPQPQKKAIRRSSIIDSGDENRTLMHERGCFRSHFRTACLFVMLEWVFVT